MKADTRKAYITAILFPAAVALAILMPEDTGKNLVLAAICILYAVLTALLLKKRSILCFERTLVAVIVAAACAVMIVLSFMMGIKFGFAKNPFAHVYIWKYILPFTAIVISSEQMRRVMLSEHSKFILIYMLFAFVFLDCVMQMRQGTFERFQTFVSFVGLTAFPAISTNLLCTLLARRYGALPNTILRLVLLLWKFLFPVVPQIPDILNALFRFVFPLLLGGLLYLLLAKRRRRSLGKKSRVGNLAFGALCIVALLLAMLISCQFSYCFLVIASPSMTGAIDKGDGIIYHAYKGEEIHEGEILVFNKGDIQVVHRVIDIQYIDGEFRYYTRGDANEADDPWYVTGSDIEGVVLARVRYVGFPTLALRSLFG